MSSSPPNFGPALTVVIPTRNRSAEVCRAVSSVLASPSRDIEVIVIDDGSNDGTETRLGAFNDERLRYRFLESGGNANFARNMGAELAQAPLIAFLDSDDMFSPGRTAHLIAFFASHQNVDCRVDGYVECSRGRRVIHRLPQGEFDPSILRHLLLAHVIPLTNSTIAVRRRAFEEIGGFDPSMPRHQDRDLLLRLGQRHRIALRDEVEVEKYRTGKSISHTFDGYIEGLDALAARNPDYCFPANRDLFSYLIARGILKTLFAGRVSAVVREIRNLRQAKNLPGGFLPNLTRYRRGRKHRKQLESKFRQALTTRLGVEQTTE